MSIETRRAENIVDPYERQPNRDNLRDHLHTTFRVDRLDDSKIPRELRTDRRTNGIVTAIRLNFPESGQGVDLYLALSSGRSKLHQPLFEQANIKPGPTIDVNWEDHTYRIGAQFTVEGNRTHLGIMYDDVSIKLAQNFKQLGQIVRDGLMQGIARHYTPDSCSEHEFAITESVAFTGTTRPRFDQYFYRYPLQNE